MVVRDGCLPVNFGRDAVRDLSVGQSGTKSVCVVGERPVPQSFWSIWGRSILWVKGATRRLRTSRATSQRYPRRQRIPVVAPAHDLAVLNKSDRDEPIVVGGAGLE